MLTLLAGALQQQAGSVPSGRWDHVHNFRPSWTQLKGIGMLPRGLWDDVRNFRLSRAQLKGIGLRMLHNHVLWGCLVGIILNLSKIGPKWLDPGARVGGVRREVAQAVLFDTVSECLRGGHPFLAVDCTLQAARVQLLRMRCP